MMNGIGERVRSKSTIALLCLLCMAVVFAFSAQPAFAVSKAAFVKSKVNNVKVKSKDYKTVTVSWATVKGAQGYIVYMSRTHHGKYRQVAMVRKGTVKSADVGGLVTGKDYYFKVRAFMRTGGKILNNYSYAKAGKAVPAKPVISVNAVEVLAPATRIDVSFPKVSGASGYEIYRSQKKSGGFRKIATLKSGKRFYQDRKAKVSVRYYYKVRAFRTVGSRKIQGKFSKAASAVYTRLSGNAAKYNPDRQGRQTPDFGKMTVYFLGSSVTRGRGAEGVAFPDYLKSMHGLNMVKQAVDGTTLANKYPNSYVARLSNLPQTAPDLLVCQLSSNDSRRGVSMGTVNKKSFAMEDFNTQTISGAIEYIAAYSRDVWGCPVVFYTLPRFSSEKFDDATYAKMVTRLKGIQNKWGDEQMILLDFWNDTEVNQKLRSNEKLYMMDPIHPTKAGYLNLYTPGFTDLLSDVLKNKSGAHKKGQGSGEREYQPDPAEAAPVILNDEGLPADPALQP